MYQYPVILYSSTINFKQKWSNKLIMTSRSIQQIGLLISLLNRRHLKQYWLLKNREKLCISPTPFGIFKNYPVRPMTKPTLLSWCIIISHMSSDTTVILTGNAETSVMQTRIFKNRPNGNNAVRKKISLLSCLVLYFKKITV